MPKTFVIDTNVIFYDPEAFMKFPGHHVVIPMSVLDELDRKKKQRDELGKAARDSVQLLDHLRQTLDGEFHSGLQMPDGGTLRIALELRGDGPPALAPSSENRVILDAHHIAETGAQVVFVSKDFAARVKAEAIGLQAEDYRNFRASYDEIPREIPTLEVTKHQIDTFFKDGKLPPPEGVQLYPNEYCLLKSSENSSALAHFNAASGNLETMIARPSDIWGIEPRNVEQQCAIDLLLRDDVNLVTLIGPAGTGKTLLAVACGLRKVFDEGVYSRMLVSRPIVPLGKDIGYLPGTKEEKLYHWMRPIHDNLEVLCGAKGSEPTDTLRWIVDSNKLEMEAVTYIRGRTLPSVYIIIDEAQNLTPHELKTIISRAGKGAKVVLTGDPTQIDNPYLDRNSNGLTYTVSRFHEQQLHGHMFLEKTERSALAAIAADIM